MRIFIASSNELEHERTFLTGGVSWPLNGMLYSMGYDERIEPEKWEYLDSSMGVEHKQEEYNRALSSCDGVVVLFWRKFGEYTESEFLTALRSARTGGTVRRLAVLFKETGESPSPELAAFKRNCATIYGVEPESFSSDTELRDKFVSLVFDLFHEKHPDLPFPTTQCSSNTGCHEGRRRNARKTLRVFVSFSNDLAEVGTAVQDLLVQLNKHFKARGVEFLPTLPGQGPADGDLALALYWKDFGDLPKAGFEKAYETFKSSKTPKIYVFFKDPDEGITAALKSFRDSFAVKYGHFYCHFENIDSVKFQMTMQGISLLPNAKTRDAFKVEGGEVRLGNELVAKLENLPFARFNARRRNLRRQLDAKEREVSELKADLAENPDDRELQDLLWQANAQRHDLMEELNQHDEFLFSTASFFARESGKEMDKRVRQARDLFERGRVVEANSLLNLPAMVERANRNLDLFREHRANCEGDIQGFLAKAEMVMADGTTPYQDRFTQACEAYDNAIRIARRIAYNGAELAAMLFDFANLLISQHHYEPSIELLEESLKIARRLAKENFELYAESVVTTLGSLAYSHRYTGQFEKAEDEYRQALAICRQLVETQSEAHESRLVWLLSSIACLHGATQQLAEAREEYREVREICQRRMAEYPDEYEPFAAMSLTDLAILRDDTQQPEETEKMLREALRIYQRLAKQDPDNYDSYVAWTLKTMAAFHVDAQELDEAAGEYVNALKIYWRLAEYNPEVYKPDEAQTLIDLAVLHSNAGQLDMAEMEFNASLKIFRKLAKERPEEYEPYVAVTLIDEALFHVGTRQFEEALAEAKESKALCERYPEALKEHEKRVLEIIEELQNTHEP